MRTIEEARAYQREYSRNWRLNEDNREKQRNYYKKWYEKNGRNRADGYAETIIKWQENHPEVVEAIWKLNFAIKTGKIIKPKECSSCGKNRRLSAHHDDYSKPLEVLWLCSSCHKLKHQKIKLNQ